MHFSQPSVKNLSVSHGIKRSSRAKVSPLIDYLRSTIVQLFTTNPGGCQMEKEPNDKIFNMKMPDKMWRIVSILSFRDNVSMAQWIRNAIEERIKQDDIRLKK